METKICTKCGEEKLLSEFVYMPNKGRRRARCINCRRVDDREYRQRTKDHIKEYKRLYYAKNPEKQKKYRATFHSDPEKKERTLTQVRRYYASAKGKSITNKRNKKYREELTDQYIIGRIQRVTGLSFLLIKQHPDWIEKKRESITMFRYYKQLKSKNNEGSK